MKNDNSNSWCEGKEERKEGNKEKKEELRADKSE